MSADNWAICPKCKDKAIKAYEARVLGLAEKYGKIPPEEYIKASRDVHNVEELEETLREDYEFYLDDNGMFHAVYCAGCDFSFEFKETKTAYAKP